MTDECPNCYEVLQIKTLEVDFDRRKKIIYCLNCRKSFEVDIY